MAVIEGLLAVVADHGVVLTLASVLIIVVAPLARTVARVSRAALWDIYLRLLGVPVDKRIAMILELAQRDLVPPDHHVDPEQPADRDG